MCPKSRRFRNDTERLEKLFELYTKMTAAMGHEKKSAPKTVKARKTSTRTMTL
jgi:hypothetical protein